MGTILESRRCVLLATGYEKAAIIAAAIEGPITIMVPASVLQRHANCVIVLDEAAASCLNRPDHCRSVVENDHRAESLVESGTASTTRT
jgi:glucosamine-6-phosphate deaminase